MSRSSKDEKSQSGKKAAAAEFKRATVVDDYDEGPDSLGFRELRNAQRDIQMALILDRNAADIINTATAANNGQPNVMLSLLTAGAQDIAGFAKSAVVRELGSLSFLELLTMGLGPDDITRFKSRDPKLTDTSLVTVAYLDPKLHVVRLCTEEGAYEPQCVNMTLAPRPN